MGITLVALVLALMAMSVFRRCGMLSLWACGLLRGLVHGLPGAELPEGFVERDVGSGWSEAVGLAFGRDAGGAHDRVYVWERTGRVWIVENGVKLEPPLLDIREEVGAWRDLGLLGFALDPDFATNGQFYVLYVVDRHHLLKFGTAEYDPEANEYYAATIGRLTRYTARGGDGFRTADPASRKVLIGETAGTGFPILNRTHGTGSLAFGADGTLLASCGDGASPETMDPGGSAGQSYGPQALADGIITETENIGAFRCQSLDSLSGKIVRIDPTTGDGVPSNPYFQGEAPRSPRSRVWAAGLRNPMRLTLKPGTGQPDPAAGQPGVLMIGDVGWMASEDLEVADGPGRNFGWPLYEGFSRNDSYWNARPPGMDAVDWVKPRAAWRKDALALTPGGVVEAFGAAGTTVAGANFSGNCSIGGVWYAGTDFPDEWRDVYFHADFGGRWIRAFSLDENHFVTGQRTFLTGAAITSMATHPVTGGLYYVSWSGGVKKISYAPPPAPSPGLKGEYFVGANFATPVATRIDHGLQFYWPESTPPAPGVPGDDFSVRWTGRLTAPASGTWQLFADVDDGLRVWVDGQLVLDHWNPTPNVYWGLASIPLTLTAGVAYDFKVEYQDFFSDAYLDLHWAGPDTPRQRVPATAYSQPPLTAPGLVGEYFSGENFGTPATSRVDPRLEFYWPESTPPAPSVPGDYFSVRWTGRLTAPASGPWQLFADVDDGLRIWVDGQLVLDHWNPTPNVYWGLASIPLTLTAGIAYDFKVEYQDFFSDAYLDLHWAGPDTPRQRVPATAYSHVPTSPRQAPTAPAIMRLADGSLELRFARDAGNRAATLLQASPDMIHWHDIPDPGWPTTSQDDGTELVRVPNACCLLDGRSAERGYFRLRVGP